jgi:tubulin-folding cofactor B
MSIVTLLISCSTSSIRAEKRFDKGLTVRGVKTKLELVVGVPAASMKLELHGTDGSTICSINDDDKFLGAYPVEDFLTLHVVNTDITAKVGEYEDVSKVEKFELSTDEYHKMSGTVLDFKRKNQMGRFNPEYANEMLAKAEAEEAAAQAIKAGDRCEVLTKTGTLRGTVKYRGEVDFGKGYWIGVQLDEPFGKHDGSVKGRKYFECPAKYGIFVKPNAVTVGDFPEEDFDLDTDDEM